MPHYCLVCVFFYFISTVHCSFYSSCFRIVVVLLARFIKIICILLASAFFSILWQKALLTNGCRFFKLYQRLLEKNHLMWEQQEKGATLEWLEVMHPFRRLFEEVSLPLCPTENTIMAHGLAIGVITSLYLRCRYASRLHFRHCSTFLLCWGRCCVFLCHWESHSAPSLGWGHCSASLFC